MSFKFSKLKDDRDDSDLFEIKEEKCSAPYASSSEDNGQHGVTPSEASEEDSSLSPLKRNGKPPQDDLHRTSRPKSVRFEIEYQTKDAMKNAKEKKTFTKSFSCSVIRAPTRKELYAPKYLSDQSSNRWSVEDHRICGLNTRLLDAIEHHKNEEVVSILRDRASPNATCRAGHVSAIHAAAYINGDVVRLLLEHGADKNRKDKYGHSPLHFAACAGRNRTIAMLLDFPLDIKNKVDLRMTPEFEEEVKALRPKVSSMIDVPCEFKTNPILPIAWKDNMEHKCRRYIQLVIPKILLGLDASPHHELCRPPQCHPATSCCWCEPKQQGCDGTDPLDIAGGKLREIDVDRPEPSTEDFRAILTRHYTDKLSNVSLDEIEMTLKQVQNRKARGEDSITSELLKAGGNPYFRNFRGYLAPFLAVEELQSYVETIKTLIEYGGEQNTAETTPPDSYSALHTAVELRSVEAIQCLLAAGAPITHHNPRGNTPLHECVSKCIKEALQIFANHSFSSEKHASIDVINSSGYTVLHAAVLASWIPGICVALDAGADVTLKAHDGYTAIHLAARQGNFDILNELLNAAGNKVASHEWSADGVESLLLCAIRSGNLECVQTIINADGSLKVTTYTHPKYDKTTFATYDPKMSVKTSSEHNMIIHAAAEIGYKDILKFLLDHDKSLLELLNYRCPDLMNTTPVEYAALHNKVHTFEFLLQKTIEIVKARSLEFDPSELMMICARAQFNLEYIFTKTIELIPDALELAINKGHLPLHEAIMRGKKDLVYNLIHKGADLSQRNECGKTALSMLYEHFPNPTKLIESIFDDYICTNSRCYDVNCTTYVDYGVLIPITNSADDDAQLRVLKALLKTVNTNDRKILLAHPLVESFLYLKWKTLSTLFYMLILLYILFAISLSVYIVSVYYYYMDKPRDVKPFWDPHVWQYCIYCTVSIVIIQELSYEYTHLFTKNWLKNMLSIEYWVKRGSFGLAIATPQVIYPDSPNEDWRRHFGTLTLVLAWVNIMMLLSKTPMSGYYMHLFWKVSTKVFKILLTFSFMFIMFPACFMIQFHLQQPFDGPIASLLKTLVMMTSEFDYANTFTKDSFGNKTLTKESPKQPVSLQMVRVVFIIFVILAAMVLMNLMIGFAVHDLQDLVLRGNVQRLEKQVKFLNRWEKSANGSRSLHHLLGIYRWFQGKKMLQRIDVTLDSTCPFKGHIREAILRKAYQQFEVKEKKQEALRNESALDKSLSAVRNCSHCTVCGSDKKSDVFPTYNYRKISNN